MSSKTQIKTENAPQAIGPYSQGIVSGPFLVLSGQVPIDPKTGKMVEGDIEMQTKQVMENIGAILHAASSNYQEIIKTTIFLRDLSHFQLVNQIYSGYFLPPYPARSTVEVSRLPLDAQIEIEVIAMRL